MPGNRRLAPTVEIRWIASGFINRLAPRDPHAAQSRTRTHRGNTLSRERVRPPNRHAGMRTLHNRRLVLIVEIHWIASGFVHRTGTPECARCTTAGSYSSWKYSEPRAGSPAEQARRNAHAAQSRTRTHRGNTLGRERDYPPDGHAGTYMLHNRGLALTAEIHRASSVCNSDYPRTTRYRRPAARAPSPLKTTALRVVRDARYPHRRESAER
jgi:hypothetical protein